MGNTTSFTGEQYFTPDQYIAIIDYMNRQFAYTPSMANIPFFREYLQPLFKRAKDMLLINQEYDTAVEFEQDGNLENSLGLSSTAGTPTTDFDNETMINMWSIGMTSNLGGGHSFVNGLSPGSTQASETRLNQAALALVIGMITSTRGQNFPNLGDSVLRQGEIINAYFQSDAQIASNKNLFTIRQQTNSMKTFFQECTRFKLLKQEGIVNLNDCDILIATKPFYLLRGTVRKLDNPLCSNNAHKNVIRRYRISDDSCCGYGRVKEGGLYVPDYDVGDPLTNSVLVIGDDAAEFFALYHLICC